MVKVSESADVTKADYERRVELLLCANDGLSDKLLMVAEIMLAPTVAAKKTATGQLKLRRHASGLETRIQRLEVSRTPRAQSPPPSTAALHPSASAPPPCRL